ncbi:MAG: hypothetical protein CME15_05300 [Gemmatimonadetes bacterium]|nr:hypothetical protein [Gemmatimonadota bacterium]
MSGRGTGPADQLFRELLTYIDNTNHPDTFERGILLILDSRHLERMGDHASNVSENAVFPPPGAGGHQYGAGLMSERSYPEVGRARGSQRLDPA